MRDVETTLLEREKRKRRRTLSIFVGVLLLFSVFLLHIWFSSRAVELACDIDLLVKEREALEEENKELMLGIAKLRSPDRISRIARNDLKMIRSLDAEVIVLKQ